MLLTHMYKTMYIHVTMKYIPMTMKYITRQKLNNKLSIVWIFLFAANS